MKKQALALIFANGLNFIVNFLMSPYLARTLTYAENGTYGQINLLSGYLVLFFAFGLPSVINLLLVENKDNIKKVVGANLWIQFISIITISILILFSGDYIGTIFNNPELPYYAKLYLPSLAMLLIMNVFSYYYIYLEKAKFYSIITVIVNLIRVSLIFIAVNYLKSLYWVIVFINITQFIQLFIHVIVLRKQIFPIPGFDWSYIQYTLRQSLPYLLLSIIGYSILYFGGIIVSNQLGVEQYAIYRNGAIEIPFIATLYGSVTAVALPKIAQDIKDGNFKMAISLKRKISNAVVALTYPIVVFCIFNGQIFINLYLGEKYVASGIVFMIFNISVLIRINAYSDILTIRKKPLIIILTNVFSFIISIVLSILLIKYFDLIGAAVSYVVSLFTLSYLLVFYTCRDLKVSISDYFDFPNIIKITFLSSIFSYISTLFMEENIFCFLIISLIYFILIYVILLKFNFIQKEYIPSPFNKILKKIKIIN